VFASGVSNSIETRASEFARERSLLEQWLADKARRFIYFGSCGVAGADNELTPYMRHKKLMESLVLSSPGGLVLRLPQVVGRTENTHTLTNYLRDRILSDEHFTVWARAERNLVDIEDIVAIGVALVEEMSDNACRVSIAAKKSLLMPEIVKIFERTLGRVANYSVVDKGTTLDIDTRAITDVSTRLGIDLGDGYIEKVIRKYYGFQ
jgi:nucleoside-diphosphate-sugar epimerase